ncbi:RHS repeat-associated core domain-containing protein, partial [Yersinia entomophaga]
SSRNHSQPEPGLKFAGQLLDEESGLHYNRFRYYDPQACCYLSPDPIGLAGGMNLYSYVPNPLTYIDPLGLASCRLNNMGRTPGKNSKTGREVIERMRGEGRIRGAGSDMRFKSSTDNKWYRVQDADMAHLTDAVKYWNQKGGYYGPKSKEVRAFMRDSKNYELEYFGHNRSQGAKLPDRYRDPSDFIGPAEMSQYF